MSYSAPPLHDRILLRPGEHTAIHGKAVLQTLLGSCVAACLYDEGSGVSGMNHFLLANKRFAKSMPINATDAGRYGINAMELLINDMLKLGAKKNRLKAKVFGAGNIISSVASDNFLCIGDVNSRFIREFLATEGIQVVSEDLGGELGRVIHFHTDSYQVFRRFIPKTETIEIEKKERRFYKVEIHRRELSEGGVVLFDS
ncbi:MAG TPA: chemotaxis protein CheD [Spirochaetaceae bacterium]|jgi:chemotaxis protein CheD|nr:chemotaxis protein CheD [Spirochaetaceae bacterium]